MDQNLLLCPVCGSPLRRVGNTARCENAHAFDYAKEGYLNLLAGRRRAGASSGDSREMALSRRVFLEKGYFARCGIRSHPMLRSTAAAARWTSAAARATIPLP